MRIILGILVFFSSLSGCSEKFDIVKDQREVYAYEKKWTYESIEHRTITWGFFTGHGLFGRVDGLHQEIVLKESNGDKVIVQDNIYALQKSGRYKKVECCYNFDTVAAVYEIEGKLFVHFLQRRDRVTDCLLSEQNTENKGLVDFFGEFNPATGRFYVRSVRRPNEEEMQLRTTMGPNWKQLRQKETVQEARKRQFIYRRPFNCEVGLN
jgi:hypothetical protein